MGILFVFVAVVGVVSWGIVKSDELSGLGRRVKAGSLRHPHGKLEQVYCEHPPVRRPFSARLRSVLPVITLPLVVVMSLGALALEHLGKARLRATGKAPLDGEFFGWLFSMGNAVRLTSPKAAAEQLREQAKAVGKAYKS